MHKELEHFLANLHPLMQRAGIGCSDQREISYGVQLRLAKDKYDAVLNLYYSDKKGISVVITGSDPNPLKGLLYSLTDSIRTPLPQARIFHHWSSWIGSDECGKGDYFGAPVVCAFAYDESLKEHFTRLRIRDSKQLRDPDIIKTAKMLYASYANRISCIVLKPAKYNELIASFKRENRNLNDLLAWLHSTNIQNLIKTQPTMQGILVDQFSPSQKVRRMLQEKKCPVPCEERTGAEADPAVAAASIIARYQFLEAFSSMRNFYQMDFPLGATSIVISRAVEFARKYGLPRLGEVAKLHFKTTGKVEEKLNKL
jgi:ribonuclease HIII